jgi:hypothetical protein
MLFFLLKSPKSKSHNPPVFYSFLIPYTPIKKLQTNLLLDQQPGRPTQHQRRRPRLRQEQQVPRPVGRHKRAHGLRAVSAALAVPPSASDAADPGQRGLPVRLLPAGPGLE